MEHLLPAKGGIILRFTGRNLDAGDADARSINHAQAKFVAVQVIARRNCPAQLQRQWIKHIGDDLKGLIGVENPLLPGVAESVKQPARRRSRC